MENTLQLTDIFDVELLQELQDNFFAATGIACGISDPNGVAITEHRSYSNLCKGYIKNSPLGLKRCQECDRIGTEMAMKNGGTVIYPCHAGLLDFAAPITVEGKLLGCFLGGQVLAEEMDEEKARTTAVELGIDPDIFFATIKEVPIYPIEKLKNYANFLYSIGNMISDISYTKYHIQRASTEIEREANMKSDFLANMSHEIRTPMNAVIGMAEMALREELPPVARDYINQIKTSGNTLLTIINDILDFSKISSGKMDINMVEYEPLDIIKDVTNIIMTRIGSKKLELVVDFDPKIPYQLMGDNIRINQVIMNLANNAVKFTKEGKVSVKIGFAKKGEREIILQVSVQDTGIGIKEEDISKLFQSFQQLDSKRNRNIEGSGLGLAISKRLVSLMNGKLWLESEYGKGSTFFFEIPQLVLNDMPSLEIQDTSVCVAVLCENVYVKDSLKRDLERFDVKQLEVQPIDSLECLLENDASFFFIDYPLFTSEVKTFVEQNPSITAVLMIEFRMIVEYNIPNLLVVKKPLYSLNIGTILNQRELYLDYDPTRNEETSFIAPEAEILIVDDNEVNLSVAAGLLKPLQMKIETALSGKEAIDKITLKHYDLVFMDHMMPELDGVETTHIIRRFHEEYNDVPIIALTANAVEEMRSMFLCEGMNDFIAKPIEFPVLVSKLKQWLPKEKIKIVVAEDMTTSASEDLAASESDRGIPAELEGIDIAMALHYLGTEKLFWEVLRDFYNVIERKASTLELFYQKKDWEHFTIDVHALKSASRQIGAVQLSDMAMELEKAGKEGNVDFIEKNVDKLIQIYRGYKDLLKPYFVEEENTQKTEKPVSSKEKLLLLFDASKEALDNLDMDEMEKILAIYQQYSYPSEQQELFMRLKDAVESLDAATCEDVILEWEQLLS